MANLKHKKSKTNKLLVLGKGWVRIILKPSPVVAPPFSMKCGS